jgi:putative transcriptional regulator
MKQKKSNVAASIVTGLSQALEHERGTSPSRVSTVTVEPVPQYTSSRIRMIRSRLHLTQRIFAAVLGVSQKTVEAWESGKNKPNGPAQRMISLMERDSNFLERSKIVLTK